MKKCWSHCGSLFATVAFIGLVPSTSTHAQDTAKQEIERWRPKNGIYAITDKDFAKRCENLGDFSVALNEKIITGDEWNCEVTQLTDTGPAAIRLNMSCSDVNLESAISKPDPNSKEMRFEETMTFRKADGKILFIRKSQNGKINFPETRVAYCPPKAQQAYLQLKAKADASAAQRKAAEMSAWRPRDGIYARAGADFNERCMTSGDMTIDLASASASRDGLACDISDVTVTPRDTVSLSLACGRKPISSDSAMKKAASEQPGAEIMTVSRIDDQSVLMRKFESGKITEFGQRLLYCPDAAQRAHADSRKAK
jgi:hypothetical protein